MHVCRRRFVHRCLIWWWIDTLHRLSTCGHQVPWRPMWNLDNRGLTVTLIYSRGGAVFPTVWAPAVRLFGIGMNVLYVLYVDVDTVHASSLQTLCTFQPVEWWLPLISSLLTHNLMLLGVLGKTVATFRQRQLMIWGFWRYRYDNGGLYLIQNIHSDRLKPSDCLIGGPHVGAWGRLRRHMVLCLSKLS